ncbi:MAG: transposase [Planctomycetota bacterium]|nr:transposase [Planctomycetota bacterium]
MTGTNIRHSLKTLLRQSIYGRLAGHDFADNQVRLQLFALAYNLGNFLRRLAMPKAVKHWTLTTLRDKLIKIGCKVVHHARQVVFQLAEVAVPRQLFRAILRRIERLRLLIPTPA